MAGVMSVESCGRLFANPDRGGSANYGIDSMGRVGLYVKEADRAWTSSDSDNDNQAVTIEVSNSETGGEWPVSEAAYNKLIELCVDICVRNGIDRLIFTGDRSGNLTMHKYFASTLCPGPFLEARFPDIAAQVNKKLEGINNAGGKEGNMDRSKAELYVRTTYAELLGRDADPEGLDTYVDQIIDRAEDDDLSDIDENIKASREYRRKFIIKAYKIFLGRMPESEAVINDRMEYARLRDIVEEILGSEEYANR